MADEAPEGWRAVADRTIAELAGRVPGDALVVQEPDRSPAPAPGRRWWRRRPPPEPRRYVQFLLLEELFCEVVGPAYWPYAPDQEDALVAAGWTEPGGDPEYDSPHYLRRWSPGQETSAVYAAIEALTTLGADPGSAWEWELVPADA